MKIIVRKKLPAVFLFILVSSQFFLCCSPKENPAKGVDELDNFFSKQFPSSEPGASILIMKDDSTIFSKGYGIANLVTQEPITPQTLFNIGSISKTFVANAILMLQEQGKLSVEDNLLKYFPDFKNKAIAEKVKIKHLLTHTSGLPDNRKVSQDTAFYITAKDAENWYPETQIDNLLFEPGSQFEYSNPAFNGLALIVEQVSGMKWQTFVEQKIMRPSGMNTSTITDGPHPEKGVSHGYVKNHGEWIEDDYGEEPTFAASGNGGVWSSTEELARYELALQKAVFLKPETVEDSRKVKRFENWSGKITDTDWSWNKPNIGWSWFVNDWQDSVRIVGHTGSQGGFIANYVSIPDKKIFFVILSNSPRDIKSYSDKIMNSLQNENWFDE
jgi:CubicO group peptidase (beta-lactamase class C family)